MEGPSFYKFLMDLPAQLELPRDFTDKYPAILPHNSTLRIASGATWKVSVEKKREERYFFTKGWTKFLQKMELQRCELLVFSYVGDSTFHVTAYAVDSCEKDSNFRVTAYATESCEKDSNPHLSFAMLMKGYNQYKIQLPQRFGKAAGLKEGEMVVVEYPDSGKSKKVLLSGRSNYLDLRRGWLKFWRNCEMRPGKSYSFEFLPTRKVIQVRPLPKEELVVF